MEKIGGFSMNHMIQEIDFENEANNARRTAKVIASDKSLVHRIYIPVAYADLSSKRVLTTE